MRRYDITYCETNGSYLAGCQVERLQVSVYAASQEAAIAQVTGGGLCTERAYIISVR